MKKQYVITLIVSLSIIFSITGEELFKDEKEIETTKQIELKESAIPVVPGTKYKISFSARTNSKHTIEANERVRLLALRYLAATLRLYFYDENGKKFSHNYINIPVISQQFHQYIRVFYPPSKARKMTLLLIPRNNSNIAVKDITISTDLCEAEKECINVHPSFEYGDLNLYGHSLGAGGMFYTRPDGKTVWKTGFLGYTPAFAVKDNTFYNTFCRAKKYRGRKSWLVLECYDGKSRRPFKEMKVEFSEKGKHTKLKIPANTLSCKLRCYCVILEEFKVSESAE
jgi:hypothetical protein